MKKKIIHLTFISIFLALIAVACGEEDNGKKENNLKTVELITVLESDGQAASIGDTILLSNGRDFRLTKFKVYLSHVNLVDANGDKKEITEVALADIGDAVTGSLSTTIEKGTYTRLELGLGLDPILNDSDPTSFESSHPLSTFNQMYWSMLKYRFLIIEGRSNTAGNLGSADDMLHAYHPGTDPTFRTVSFNLNPNFSAQLNSGKGTLELVFDLDKIFNLPPAIDMVTEPQTHSEPIDIDVAIKIMNNLEQSIKLRLP